MKILIVDDNANNRMVVKLLLEDYAENNNKTFEISECENGLLAVNLAKVEKFNIILMDIVMPVMDGIEATKKIRANDKEVMIIAVSAVDDELRQKEILRNGAEDYIPKPIDSELLFSRLESYLSLSKLRHHDDLSLNRKAANLYTKTILRRQTIFYATCEEALAEFWEYYLLRETPSKLDGLSDVVRTIFTIGESIIRLDGEPWIIVEADNEAIYFTINQVQVVGSKIVEMIIKKNRVVYDYKTSEEKVSFKLIQNFAKEENEKPVVKEKVKEVVVENVPEKKVEIKKTNIQEYKVFNYIDPDDLDEVKECLGDLSSLILMLGRSDISASEVSEIAQHLEKLGKILSVYTEAYSVGLSLTQLSREIRSHEDRFLEISGDIAILSAAFTSDLNTWYKMIFSEGAPSVNFMDDTIIADSKTICAMLQEDDVCDVDIDDIFDF